MPGEDTHALMIEVARLRQENGRLETAARAYIEGHELALTRAETAEAALAAARREGSDKERRLRQFLTMCADELDRADKNGGEWERVWDVRARLAALGATLGRLGEEEWLPSAALAAPAAGDSK